MSWLLRLLVLITLLSLFCFSGVGAVPLLSFYSLAQQLFQPAAAIHAQQPTAARPTTAHSRPTATHPW